MLNDGVLKGKESCLLVIKKGVKLGGTAVLGDGNLIERRSDERARLVRNTGVNWFRKTCRLPNLARTNCGDNLNREWETGPVMVSSSADRRHMLDCL